ncbi:MAG: hypothetical protein Tsb0014_31070 [Pleurocapsa sp.]
MTNLIDTIIVPQGTEYQAVCRGLKEIDGPKPRVIAIPIGVNQEIQSFAAKRVLMMGLCGSLSPHHSVGDGVLYQACYNLHRSCLSTDLELTNLIAARLQNSVSLVTGLTSDRVIGQAKEKSILSQNYPATVVDMEGFSYLQNLQQQDVAVSILRVVSDDCFTDIPNLDRAIDSDGNLKFGHLAIAMLKQPFPAFKLITGSLTGLKKLQQLTTQLFNRLS